MLTVLTWMDLTPQYKSLGSTALAQDQLWRDCIENISYNPDNKPDCYLAATATLHPSPAVANTLSISPSLLHLVSAPKRCVATAHLAISL